MAQIQNSESSISINVITSHRFLQVTNHDSPLQHMVCRKCKQPALMEYWEWSEIAEDKLQCPHCLAVVRIGEWVDGVPEEKPKQLCVICGGTGQVM